MIKILFLCLCKLISQLQHAPICRQSVSVAWLLFEGPVDADRLTHVVLLVEVCNSLLGFLEAGVFEQCVAFDIASPAVEVQHAILDLTMLTKLVVQVFLLKLIWETSHNQNEPLNRLDDRPWLPVRRQPRKCLLARFR